MRNPKEQRKIYHNISHESLSRAYPCYPWAYSILLSIDLLRNPYQIPTIDSIGIDIWTMDKGIIFDNIVVDKNPEKAIQGWDAALQ